MIKNCHFQLQKIEDISQQIARNNDSLKDKATESAHFTVHTSLWSSTSTQEQVVDSRATRYMMKHWNLFSYYSYQHKGEQVTIVDNSTLLESSCSTIQIENAQCKYVLHVPSVEPNLLSIYCIAQANSRR